MKYKFIYIITVLFLLNILYCSAESYYNIYTLPVCYNESMVKVHYQDNQTDGRYKINNCTVNEKFLWTCPCEHLNQTLILITDNKVQDVFDFVIQYYVASKLPEDDGDDSMPSLNEITNGNNQRIVNINNLAINPKPVEIPKLESGVLLTIVLIVCSIILFFIIAIFLWYKAFLSEPNQIEQINRRKAINKVSDEEVKAFLESLKKK